MYEFSEKEVERIIEILRGSINSLEYACSQIDEDCDAEDLTDWQLHRIDEEIFECGICGWWCDIESQSSDGENCIECNPDDDEEN